MLALLMSAHIAPELEERRAALGMSVQALSRRSGVPIATLRRVLYSAGYRSTYDDVLAIAWALGLTIRLEGTPAGEFRQRQAEQAAGNPSRATRLLSQRGRSLWQAGATSGR